MSQRTRMDGLFEQLRYAERSARARLLAGHADDVTKIERYFIHPMKVAERSACDALTGIGTVDDADLAAALRQEAFERIASACAESIFANVSLRLRARFRMYVDEIAQAEVRIADAISAAHLVRAKRILPRMFAVGRIDADALAIPRAPDDEASIEDWLELLSRAIHDELAAASKRALEKLLDQGYTRLGIIKTRIDLALCVPTRSDATKVSRVGWA